jgi:ABC-type lipoprotein release transport system permease subunit
LIRAIARESSYRFRATFRRRWTGYLTLVMLLGLVGGVAMAAAAGARRTQSSFPTYLANTNPADLQVFAEFGPITKTGFSEKVNEAVARVPGVERAVDVVGFDGTLQILGHRDVPGVSGEAPPSLEGSPNGEYFSTDRVTVLRGRMADPDRMDEIVMSAGGAAEYGLHLGSTLRVSFFTDAQVKNPNFTGYPQDKPHLIVPFKLVGIVESSPQVVEDDDAALGDQVAVITPSLTKRLETCCAYYSYVSLHLRGGAAREVAVASAVNKVVPQLGPVGGATTWAPYVAKAERAIRPEAIAIGVFGLIATLAALVINGQVISRLVRRNTVESAIVRALGAEPAMVMADGLIGVLAAVLTGALLAVAVAIALSPLAPFGPVRPVYPNVGVSFDWTVLGFGFLLFVVVLGSAAMAVTYRVAPHRLASKTSAPVRNPVWSKAASAGLPPSAVLGLRSALGSGPGSGSERDAAPVRSALLGAVIAVVVIVTSITFGASLNSLVSQPPLYGWNWDYALLAGFSAAENLPAAETATLLDHDPDVAHWTGVYFVEAELDGRSVPVLAMHPNAPVSPSMLSGHALASSSQIVLGPATLASLHAHLGGTVVATVDGHARALHVVGGATLPTIGGSGNPVLAMGSGAVISTSLFSPSDLNQQDSAVPGPMAVFITVRPGVSNAAALRSLDHITAVLNRTSDLDGPVGGVVSALRPVEIANYRTVGTTPAVLAAVLATGALAALGLTLVASVRQRRRQFAVLKALGFTQRQLAASVAWQSSVAAVVGVVVGVPAGIALGRWLWTMFADGISAVPHPTVPALSVALVALGAIVFANLVALLPGRVAARTRTSLLLRAE